MQTHSSKGPVTSISEGNSLEALPKATQQILMFKGAGWLSDRNIATMICIFEANLSAVTTFLVAANDETILCSWVLQTLYVKDGNMNANVVI